MAEHVCPVWVGYLLASPFRKLFQNPKKILGPYIKSGTTVVDAGCAMGYFSLAIAEMVGPEGRVVCVDLQEKMLISLKKRALRARLLDRIEARLCRAESLGIGDLNGTIDFALAFAMVHEVPDTASLFEDFYGALRPGGLLLVAEPAGRVTPAGFKETLDLGQKAGFSVWDEPKISRSHSVLLKKPSAK
jgi:ubiquinone/menaquinone biosynthesis C-methylase UbiE